jgi:hypothetical protein
MPYAFPQLPHFSWIQAFVVSFMLTIFKGTKELPEKFENDIPGYIVHCIGEKTGCLVIGVPIALVLYLFLT